MRGRSQAHTTHIAALTRASLDARRDRLEGYATKLAKVCQDIENNDEKCLVLIHARHGHKLLLRLLRAKFDDKVCSRP